jgi:hypothetical protein
MIRAPKGRNRIVNEPLQFRIARDLFLELVVYKIQKNIVVGYLSAPKVQQTHYRAILSMVNGAFFGAAATIVVLLDAACLQTLSSI